MIRNWWTSGKSRLKLEPIVNLKHQTRELPDGSRISELLETDELVPYLHEDARTIYDSVLRGLRLSNNGPMLGSRVKQEDGSEPYVWLTYQEVIDRADILSYGLISQNLLCRRNNYIGLFAKNCPEWIIVELSTYRTGSVLVPLYETLGSDALTFIINQTEMELIFCDTEERATAVLKKKSQCRLLKTIIIMEQISTELSRMAVNNGVDIRSFSSLEILGKSLSQKPLLKVPQPEDVCTICYTSGTTGTPKGVVLTHANVIACMTARSYVRNVNLSCKDVVISFLPLAHMYERIIEYIFYQLGASIGFFRGDIRALAEDFKELRPTIVALVPRVLNRVYDKVMSELNKSFFKKTVFGTALAFKKRDIKNGVLRNNTIFDRLVFKKIREGLGGHVKLIICGSAPLAENVMRFARSAMGCVVLEGYGQTECVAACTLGLEADSTAGHVGIPSICNAIKLMDAPEIGYFASNQVGEICIKGYNVFKGYFKNESLTKEVYDKNGWLHTGDIGQWLSNGTLKIIDRKKHIFKLSQGEYISPEKIENVYLLSKFVSQLFVHGDSLRTALVGVVVPDPECLSRALSERCNIRGKSFKEICCLVEAKKILFEEMTTFGKKAGLCSFEQVKAIHLYPELFSVENGLLTPTLKNKRPNLKKFFSTQIQEMYSDLT
ncbi:unnamed protein product [Enterobius vermicularis]|uniref:Long-chain-fatty-acid--CoA ligase n=1 Tax=Enterobius vermicularis TaxID=51028 RepID=A0A0N4UX52_ENTVE|nr:unnamed protein product [Enterobius vermicularis]